MTRAHPPSAPWGEPARGGGRARPGPLPRSGPTPWARLSGGARPRASQGVPRRLSDALRAGWSLRGSSGSSEGLWPRLRASKGFSGPLGPRAAHAGFRGFSRPLGPQAAHAGLGTPPRWPPQEFPPGPWAVGPQMRASGHPLRWPPREFPPGPSALGPRMRASGDLRGGRRGSFRLLKASRAGTFSPEVREGVSSTPCGTRRLPAQRRVGRAVFRGSCAGWVAEGLTGQAGPWRAPWARLRGSGNSAAAARRRKRPEQGCCRNSRRRPGSARCGGQAAAHGAACPAAGRASRVLAGPSKSLLTVRLQVPAAGRSPLGHAQHFPGHRRRVRPAFANYVERDLKRFAGVERSSGWRRLSCQCRVTGSGRRRGPS